MAKSSDSTCDAAKVHRRRFLIMDLACVGLMLIYLSHGLVLGQLRLIFWDWVALGVLTPVMVLAWFSFSRWLHPTPFHVQEYSRREEAYQNLLVKYHTLRGVVNRGLALVPMAVMWGLMILGSPPSASYFAMGLSVRLSGGKL